MKHVLFRIIINFLIMFKTNSMYTQPLFVWTFGIIVEVIHYYILLSNQLCTIQQPSD